MMNEVVQQASSRLPVLAQSIIDCEKKKALIRRVDGLIIGTGKSDFTQGNVPYALKYKGKIFELIDVPGIEGDESRFIGLVQEAVAKAHLVFYVNGTNKKPEKATAAKIRSYLRRGSSVCPLVNVRGSADSYEFEEDRESLDQGSGGVILKQTEAVLASALGEHVLLPGHCVQGLIGFSSLSFDHELSASTVHPDRESDLVRHQRNFLNHFDDSDAMYRFSQMESVVEVLTGKLSTFREDIVESNKAKVRELLAENLNVLKETLESHKEFVARVAPEFDKCRAAITEAVSSFERLVTSARRNIYNELFNKLVEDSDNIVADNFGEAADIKREIESAFERHSQDAQAELEASLEKNMGGLQSQLEESVERLLEDVERVKFQQKVRADQASRWSFQHSDDLGWNLGLGDFGSFAFQIGSYALSGAAVGTFLPGLGTIIGGAVGAALGLAMALLNLFMSKARRIRKSQVEVRKKFESLRDKKLADIEPEISALMESVRKSVEEDVVQQVDVLEKSLDAPLEVIDKQISALSHVKNTIEMMPYGSTKAV
ncbi:hypothetical protein SAMN04488490_0266 [Marinobacter sp. LV10R510-11A]|uniref:hypothetical protein n=1 Tax=Marinobacter sp. LV10R510-11A TaxID=1415568 RepID=UPI000BC069D7|nr:hypothetical protein [Marinobacter sp. LV10R510-11A]SOB74740.1 hypothetical protein SAMN04488490_0266 [Marinobacter sp. LV10R510-11A]